MLVAIVMACYTVGPIVGFGAGAAFLKLYVTLGGWFYLLSKNLIC